MLTVLFIWAYVIATTYLIGYGFLMSLVNLPGMRHMKGKKRAKEGRRYDFKFKESYIITGVVLVTVFAQIVSLFSKVSVGANAFLISVCVLIAVYYRWELYEDFAGMFGRMKADANLYVYLVVFLNHQFEHFVCNELGYRVVHGAA